jgi:hypothetical protein
MKTLITNNGQIGPFASITRTTDNNGWLADQCIYPDGVIGEATVEDYVEPVRIIKQEVPKEITMRQARLALLGAGLLSTVATTIEAMPEPQKSAANIEWEYSNTVLRHNGFVSVLGPLLGLTEQQIDDLFILASTL